MKNVTAEQWYKKLRSSQVAGWKQRKEKQIHWVIELTVAWWFRVQKYKQRENKQENVTEDRSSTDFLNVGLGITFSSIPVYVDSQNLTY